MPRLTEDRLNIADELREDLGRVGILTVEQARLFSQAVRLSWGGSSLNIWTAERSAQQLNDARRLVEMAAVFAELGENAKAEDLWRRAGDLFEWLSRSRATEPSAQEQLVPLTLLGAASFQLAGLPAMASALLGQTYPGVPAGAIFAAFLRADFLGVINAVADFWAANLDLTRPAAEAPMSPNDLLFLCAELVRTLGLIAASLQMDQRARLEIALARLRSLARIATRARSEDVWLVIELTSRVADRFAAQSLWKGVTPLRQRMPPEGARRLAEYVQGMFQRGRGLLWPSQREGIARVAESGSFALCTPTGSGKTTVAELALLDALYAETAPAAPLAIYLVPSRALASEVEARFAGSIGRVDSELTITGLYGGTEWSLSDEWVTATGPTVLVSTVEMADALMRHLGPLLLPRIVLIVVDEAHQVQFVDSPQYQENLRRSDHRGARLEQFLMRLFACAPQSRALALSAVAGGVENAIARWMSREPEAEATGSRYRSTRQLIGALECRANNTVLVRLDRLDGEGLGIADSEETAYIPVPFVAMPRVTGKFRSDMSRFARAHTLWAALQIAKAKRTVLISITREIDQVAADYRELLENVATWKVLEPNVLRDHVSEVFSACAVACEDYCGTDSNELFLLRRGIAVHHGQLPVRVRRLMTEVIRTGATPVALATSTLTEGVNLPFDVVIVPSILRKQFAGYLSDGTPRYDWTILPPAEFLNLAGRAGRPGTMGEGLTLVALATEATARPQTKARRKQNQQIRTQRERFAQLLRSLQSSSIHGTDPKSPVAELLRLLHTLWQQLMPLGTYDQFLAWLEVANHPDSAPPLSGHVALAGEALDSLDLVLLAAIQEVEALRGGPLEPAELERHLKRVWSCSFARFASEEQERLEASFVKRGRVLTERLYVDAARRRELYRLGLPPRQGTSFLSVAARIEQQLRELGEFPRWTREVRFASIETIANLAQQTPGFQFRTEGVEWRQVLRWWLQAPEARPPSADEVQSWLRMATGDFEYRLGTAIGTTLSAIWNRVAGDSLEVPSLEQWQDATNLPWSAIWLRELLAWGTLEPMVAYLVATNHAKSRSEAMTRLPEYQTWLQGHQNVTGGDEIYNPRRLREWVEETWPKRRIQRDARSEIRATAIGEFPQSPAEYPVLSLVLNDEINWLDPAGYVLAKSVGATMKVLNHERAWLSPHAGKVRLSSW